MMIVTKGWLKYRPFSYLYVGSYGGITMWGFIVALVSGALMSIQGVFNTEVTKQTSLWVSTGWVQLSAFAVCVLAWLLQAEKVSLHCGRWKINIRCWAEL